MQATGHGSLVGIQNRRMGISRVADIVNYLHRNGSIRRLIQGSYYRFPIVLSLSCRLDQLHCPYEVWLSPMSNRPVLSSNRVKASQSEKVDLPTELPPLCSIARVCSQQFHILTYALTSPRQPPSHKRLTSDHTTLSLVPSHGGGGGRFHRVQSSSWSVVRPHRA